MKQKKFACWVCGIEEPQPYKASNLGPGISAQDFAITDVNYGVTGELVKCAQCGFVQCSNLTDVLNYYEDLKDPSYEATRKGRALQADKMLSVILEYAKGKKLLDIGAGSGILVEQAQERGFTAMGVEPSRWLWQKAQVRDLPVFLGTFPHPNSKDFFDVITLIDVIEHVPDPVGLLKDAEKALSPEGIIVVATPDIGVLLARILGKAWWHLRVAHIGYFNVKTLKLAAGRAGLISIYEGRAKWYFAVDFVLARFNGYLPNFAKLPPKKFLQRITIPLNLGDSMFLMFKRQAGLPPKV